MSSGRYLLASVLVLAISAASSSKCYQFFLQEFISFPKEESFGLVTKTGHTFLKQDCDFEYWYSIQSASVWAR